MNAVPTWIHFRQRISSRIALIEKFFKCSDNIETLTNSRNDFVIETLKKSFAGGEHTLNLVEILLESCLLVPLNSNLNSLKKPDIDSLLFHLQKQQNNENYLLENCEQCHFWELVSDTLYNILYSEMNNEEHDFCRNVWHQFLFITTRQPQTVFELCIKILQYIIESLPKSKLNYHQLAITSVVRNSFLIRYELTFLGGREMFINNIPLIQSQKATLRLVQIMKNLKEGFSSGVLWQILKKILPHTHNFQEEEKISFKKKRKNVKKIEFTVLFNSATYSLVGSSDTAFWQEGTVTDAIVSSSLVIDNSDGIINDKIAFSIFKCLALFQLTQDFQFRRQGNKAVIGIWFDQILANFDDNNDQINTSIPLLKDDEVRINTYALLCIQKLLTNFVVKSSTINLLDFLSNWLLSIFNIKFSTAEMGILILSSILGNLSMLNLLKSEILEKFIKYPQYSLCDKDSVALSRQFIPFKHSKKSLVRKWSRPFDVLFYVPSEFRGEENNMALVPYSSRYPSLYIRIKNKEKAVKWAIAIMMRNCYFVLNRRHQQSDDDTLRYDLWRSYNDEKFIMALDLVIDKASGFLCLFIDEEHEVRTFFELEDIVPVEQRGQPAYHYMGAMCLIYLRMIIDIYGLPSTLNFSQLFVNTNYIENDQLTSLFFTPPLPNWRNDSTKDVNEIFTLLVTMIMEYGIGRNKDCGSAESIFAAKLLANDIKIINCGQKFIINCLSKFPDMMMMMIEENYQQITKSLNDYLHS